MDRHPPTIKVVFFGLDPWKMIDRLVKLHGSDIDFSVFSRDQNTLFEQNAYSAAVNKLYIPDHVPPAFIDKAWKNLSSDLLFIPYALTDVKVTSCLSKLLARKRATIDGALSNPLIITLGIPSAPHDRSTLDQLFVIQQQIAQNSTVNLLLSSGKSIFGRQKYETMLIDVIAALAGLVLSPQMINLSFGDLKHALVGIKNQGVMALGSADSGIKAAKEAVELVHGQSDLASINKILIAVSCDEATGLDEIGKTVSYITRQLPAKARVFWGLTASPMKKVKVLLLCNPSDTTNAKSNVSSLGLQASKRVSALLPSFTQQNIFDDDMPEIDAYMNIGMLPGARNASANLTRERDGYDFNRRARGSVDVKENEASMFVFNEGGLLLAHVPGSEVAADSSPESEPMILSGLLSAMQKMSGNLVGSELDSFRAGAKTCIFKKMKTGEIILNGVAIYDTTKDQEQNVVSDLNRLLNLVDSMYRSSVSEMCMKDRVDTILQEHGILPALNISAY